MVQQNLTHADYVQRKRSDSGLKLRLYYKDIRGWTRGVSIRLYLFGQAFRRSIRRGLNETCPEKDVVIITKLHKCSKGTLVK